MRTYFVLVTLRGFDEIRQQAGYFRASDLLHELACKIADLCPGADKIRTSRSAVEFLLPCTSAALAAEQLREVAARIDGSIMVRGRAFPRQAIIGAARCSRQVSDRTIAEAEAALRLAATEHETVRVDDECEFDELSLMKDLHAALHEDQLALHYQPKVQARSGQVAACEALVRWTHPTLGPIAPDLFVGIAERRGEIAALTDWTILRAIEGAEWLQPRGLKVPIYVNLSARLITNDAFVSSLLEMLQGHEAAIGLELTETCMIGDPEGALASMNRLANAGLNLAIDDYGAGFSSLAYLQRLPIHELKIDRLFIARLTSGARDPLLVRSTIDLAHALEMEVTAEGVDSAAALALLQVMRCDMVQGYFLSRPLPIEELLEYGLAAANRTSLEVTASLASRFARRERRTAA